MDIEQIITRIKANKDWKEYTVFTSTTVVHLCSYKITQVQARSAIAALCRGGEINRVATGHYQRAGRVGEWLRKSWRTITNEELGIVPTRLGLL